MYIKHPFTGVTKMERKEKRAGSSRGMYHHSRIVGNGVSCGCHTERNLKSFTFYGAEKGASDFCDWVRNGELRGSEAASSTAGPANVAICCVPGNITSQFITRPSRVDSLTELPKKCNNTKDS